MHKIALKLSTFLFACGLGVLAASVIGGSTSYWPQYFTLDDQNETRSCQVKLIGRDGQTTWMSCRQWVKHREFELEHSY